MRNRNSGFRILTYPVLHNYINIIDIGFMVRLLLIRFYIGSMGVIRETTVFEKFYRNGEF